MGVFIYLFAEPRGLWDLSSPTRDATCTCCNGSKESSPLDRQGIPYTVSSCVNVDVSSTYPTDCGEEERRGLQRAL